ncbi:hypothetical protein H8E88_11805 [candidate division KSB1 bacterium]|nr:hypothetical protein [candidate division KSB1 bacterium]
MGDVPEGNELLSNVNEQGIHPDYHKQECPASNFPNINYQVEHSDNI